MSAIDFKEIPSARGGEIGQDEWVLFARELFSALGLNIEEGPDRGPDSGRDLVVTEKRMGSLGSGEHRWLVSCKHFAHSNRSVSIRDEPDILGRVRRFKADGFIAFYSTLPSSELNRTLQGYNKETNVNIYDRARIERILRGNPSLKLVFERFFPISFREHTKEYHVARTIADSVVGLSCNVCGKDLFVEQNGIVALAEKFSDDKEIHTIDMYWACRGTCDRAMEQEFRQRGLATGWESIDDLRIPLVFMNWVITTMNGIRAGINIFTDEAYEKFREFTFAMAQLVVRETTDEEKKRIITLRDIPAYLGGLEGWGPP